MIQYTLIDKNRQLTLNYPEKEGQIYAKLLLQLCDHVAPLVLIVRTSKNVMQGKSIAVVYTLCTY